MMTRSAILLVAVTLCASLLYRSVTPAYACSCGYPQSTDEVRGGIAGAQLAVIAHPAGYAEDGPDGRLVMAITRVLNGPSLDTLILQDTRETVEYDNPYTDEIGSIDPMCGYHIHGRQTDSYFLVMGKDQQDNWKAFGCMSSSLAEIFSRPATDPYRIVFSELLGPSELPPGGGPQTAEADSHEEDLPTYILLPLAFIIPLAVLLGFSFFVRRRGGGH